MAKVKWFFTRTNYHNLKEMKYFLPVKIDDYYTFISKKIFNED
jgi:hypothetical protein